MCSKTKRTRSQHFSIIVINIHVIQKFKQTLSLKVIFIIASLIRRNSITEKVNAVRNTKRATEVRDKWMNMCKYAKQRFGELERE